MEGKNENIINTQFTIAKKDLVKYEKNCGLAVVAYKFNCETDFAEEQRKYL
jgi:hypothetical protein